MSDSDRSASRVTALAMALAVASLAGCAVMPEPLTESAERESILADRQRIAQAQPAPTAPVSLDEAVARSLKYNLDHRLAMMEGVLAARQLEVLRYEMLPKLAANAGWTTRSNEYLTMSNGAVNPTASQDSNRAVWDLGLTWNILDFGVSYYQARQNADQLLIAQERQRKVVNQVVQQVRSAYWRAATAELLSKDVADMLVQARQALADARTVEKQLLAPPLETLQYQKGLVGLVKELEQLQYGEAVAKAELRSLMGLPPGSAFTVRLPTAAQMTMPEWGMGLEQMEELALLRRPELREERLQTRIASNEARKALLRLLPGVTLFATANHDSNSYLVNNNWSDAGMRVSWNLFNLLTGPKVVEASEAQQEVGEWRRMALGMAVLTQVNVGYQQFLRARGHFAQANELNRIEQRIYGHMKNAANVQAQTRLQEIRARLSSLYAEVARYQSYAELQGAIANLYVTLGMDLLPPGTTDGDLARVQVEVGKTFAQWYRGKPIDGGTE